jgi:hypothetical protein
MLIDASRGNAPPAGSQALARRFPRQDRNVARAGSWEPSRGPAAADGGACVALQCVG